MDRELRQRLAVVRRSRSWTLSFAGGAFTAILVLSGCTEDSTGSPPPPSSTTTTRSDQLVGVPAPIPSADLPFEMTATPSTASSGESVTISFSGELSEDWLHGPEATLELDVDGEWRSAWALISPDFNAAPTSLVVGFQVTVPAVGFSLTSPTVVGLPAALPPGRYRLCQGVVRTASSAGGLKSARACAELQIV